MEKKLACRRKIVVSAIGGLVSNAISFFPAYAGNEDIKVELKSMKNGGTTLFSIPFKFHPFILPNGFTISVRFPDLAPLPANAGVNGSLIAVYITDFPKSMSWADVRVESIHQLHLVEQEKNNISIYQFPPHRSGKIDLTGDIAYVWHDANGNAVVAEDFGARTLDLHHGFDERYQIRCGFSLDFRESMVQIDEKISKLIKTMIVGNEK